MDKRPLKELLITRFFQEKLVAADATAYVEYGEEAITVGSCLGLDEGDFISTYFRGEGSALRLRGGISLEDHMAICLGRKWKDGTFHASIPNGISDIEHGVVGPTSSLIGADDDVVTGVALAQKLQKTGKVVLLMLGDCATSKGNFHEAINFASVFHLPLIIMIRGNGWGMSTKVENDIGVTSIPDMVKPFGFAVKTIDGNNVFEVINTVKEAAEYVRSGQGPYLIEAVTYRMTGHSLHDEDEYRDSADKEKWAAKDPIVVCGNIMKENGATQEEIDILVKEAHDEIDRVYDEAMKRDPITVEDRLSQLETRVARMWGE